MISGFRAAEVLADAIDAEFGTEVQWVPWEKQGSSVEGIVGTAPGALEATPGSFVHGAVTGIRRQGTLGGAPYSTVPNELLQVTR